MEHAIAGRSKIRNVCIAEVFSRMGIIEQWGTGIQRTIQGCREYGVQEPEVIDMGDAFRVNFYRFGVETGTEEEAIVVLTALSGTERKIVEYILEGIGCKVNGRKVHIVY